MEEFVSVVMLCYNHEKYLSKALDSVLMQQTNFTYKIVIGDDCSPDHSQTIINTYARRYPEKFRAFCRSKNLGMNENFVDLIHHCKGKYIAYLECDDYWIDEKKLQKQVDFLESHPNYSAVAAQCRVVDQDNKVLRPMMSEYLQEEDFTLSKLKAFKQPGHMSTWLLRNFFCKDQFEIGDMLDYKHSTGDRILPILLLSQGNIRCLPDLVSSYRYDVRPDSTSWSAKHNLALKDGNLQDFERLEELEEYASTIPYPIRFTKKKLFYYGLALYYSYIHHNQGYRSAKKQMVSRMHHNPLFILRGYLTFIRLCMNSIKMRFQKKSTSILDLELGNEPTKRSVVTRNI